MYNTCAAKSLLCDETITMLHIEPFDNTSDDVSWKRLKFGGLKKAQLNATYTDTLYTETEQQLLTSHLVPHEI